MNNRYKEGSEFAENLLKRLEEQKELLEYDIIKEKERFSSNSYLNKLETQKACVQQMIRAVTSAIQDSSADKRR